MNLNFEWYATSIEKPHLAATVAVCVLLLAAFVGGGANPGILLSLLALVGATLLITRPEVGLASLALIAYWVPFEVAVSDSVSINGVMVLMPLLLGAWMVRAAIHGRGFYWSRTFPPLLALVVVALVSWFAGNANWNMLVPQSQNLYFVQFGQWVIFALSAAAFIYAAQQTVFSIKLLVVTFLVLGTVALLVRYGGALVPIRGPWSNYYAASNGTFFVWMSALAGGQALFNQRLSRIARYSLFLLAVSVPVLGFWQNTDWASSWLPPIVALMILVWLKSRSFSLFMLFVGVLLLIPFLGVLLTMYDWDFERDVSIGGRFVLWSSVLDLATASPWIGLGLTQYHQYFRFIPLLTDRGQWTSPNVNSHNLYIDLFAQLGILGLTVFVWAVAEIGGLGWRLNRAHKSDFGAAYVMSAIAGLGAMLLASGIVEWLIPFVYNVGFSGFRFSVFSWIFLGGLVAIERSQSSSA